MHIILANIFNKRGEKIMQAIQPIRTVAVSNYTMHKKSFSGDISMTGDKKTAAVDNKDIKRKVVIAAGILALTALAIAALKIIKTKKLSSMQDVPFLGTRISKTKAGRKALDAQAKINQNLKGYQYIRPAHAGVQRPGSEEVVARFLRRYA